MKLKNKVRYSYFVLSPLSTTTDYPLCKKKEGNGSNDTINTLMLR